MSTPPSSMPPPLPPLTLIVATTPSLGIGLRGTLPWPPLKSDLVFFARVTKRAPRPHRHAPSHGNSISSSSAASQTKNAVLMGRKTWDSIPTKFRPLKDRINVVVSRSPQRLELPATERWDSTPVVGVGSVEQGLRRLQSLYSRAGYKEGGSGSFTEKHGPEAGQEGEKEVVETFGLGRVFVIGGAEIYVHSLRMPNCDRILWTRLQNEFDCDTFFPKGIMPPTDEVGKDVDREGEWKVASTKDLEEWTGEDGIGGLKAEGEIKFEVCMLEKTSVC